MRKMTDVLKKNGKKIAAILVCCLMLSVTSCGSDIEYIDETGNSSSTSGDNGSDNGSGSSSSNITYTGDVEYADSENEEFQKFLKDYFVDAVTESTIDYNYTIKDGSKYGIEPPVATLGDPSMDKASIDSQKKEIQDQYDKLMTFKDVKLTEDETFTFECLKNNIELSLKLFDNIYFYEPFSPMRGLQANIPTNFTDYRFDDKSDVEDYVTLLGQMRDYFKGYIDFEYEKSKAGYFMADSVADKVIEQCDEFTADKENNFMIEVFDDRIEELDFLSKEEKEDFKKRDKEAILKSVIPAFEDLKKCITELKGTGKNSLGLCNYDGGKEYYSDYVFPSFSDSSKTPDEEIAVMEKRKQNLTGEMTLIYSSNQEAYQAFIENNDTLLEKYDKMDASEVIDYLIGHCLDDYPELDEIKYTANYMDKHMEKIMENVLAYYMSPAIDDPEHNLIYVNGAHPSGMWTTLAHEGCPGHMFQNAYFMSTNPNPVRAIMGNIGYKEGWAVYSSYGSLEQCDFGGSEYAKEFAKLTKINEDLGYLLYGRIDLGVNYEGWTVDDVKDFLSSSGYGTDFAEDIITTVIGDPGAYLSYTTGYYELEELRLLAEDELGSKFDAKEFHKVVLTAGPCSFKNLRTKVEKYIYENR
ncbi:MAG: DUF885 domain-containing protein [Eubacterium sp.]|nr:DUF885 domain-containing protein [Eubacterium sp.]